MERDIRPFLNDIPQAGLDDLLKRLSRTCWLTRFPARARTTALQLDQVKDLLEYWPTG